MPFFPFQNHLLVQEMGVILKGELTEGMLKVCVEGLSCSSLHDPTLNKKHIHLHSLYVIVKG